LGWGVAVGVSGLAAEQRSLVMHRRYSITVGHLLGLGLGWG
jgi:hypothetical protein